MIKQDSATRLDDGVMLQRVIPDRALERPDMSGEGPLYSHVQHRLERLFEAAFDSVGDAMMIIDDSYRIIAFNNALEKLTGWRRGQALGQHCYKVCCCGDIKTTGPDNSTCPLLGKKKSFGPNLRHTFTSAYGKRITVSMTHAPLLSLVYDDLYKLVVIRKDDTRKRAQRIDQDVIAATAHELLSPLNLIRGYAATISNLEGTLTSEQRKRYLRAIESASFRLTQSVRNFLDLPRIELEGLNLSRELSSLPQLLRRIVTEIQCQSMDNVIKLRASRRLPLVNMDRKKIEQVLINLLVNAIKYSPQGSDIEVSIHGAFEQKDVMEIVGNRFPVKPPCLIVSVRDSGIGIPQQELELIFEKYYRADNSLRRAIPGVGMGLYICKVIVEGHGGRIWAKSRVGEGSTFYFSLPIDEESPGNRVLKLGNPRN